MRLVYGTIRGFSDDTRIFEILLNHKVQMFYLSEVNIKNLNHI